MLIIDDTLQDYSYIHPRATQEPGVYEFVWKPKTIGNYRILADLFPFTTNTQEYAESQLVAAKNPHLSIDRRTILQNEVAGLIFKLSFEDGGLQQVGKASMGRFIITDQQSKLVNYLEPIMGSFGHIVAFSEDFKTVLHVHPMGEEPNKSGDRGGPELLFHIEPEKVGFIKLFLQVKIKGKELFVPFGITVRSQ